MKVCKHCGYENEDSFIFCGNCGKRIDGKKDCKYCNFSFDERMKYCPNCGKEYVEIKESKIKKKIDDLKENKVVLDKFSLAIFIILVSFTLLGVFIPYYKSELTFTGAFVSSEPTWGSLYLLFDGNYYTTLYDILSSTSSDSGYIVDIFRLVYIAILAILTLVFSIISLINLVGSIKDINNVKMIHVKASLISYTLLVFGSATLSYGCNVSLSPFFIVFIVISLALFLARYIYKEIFIANEKYLFKYIKDGVSFIAILFLLISLILVSFNEFSVQYSFISIDFNAIGSNSNSYGTDIAFLLVFVAFILFTFLKVFTKSIDKVKYIIYSSFSYVLFYVLIILIGTGLSVEGASLSSSLIASIVFGSIAFAFDLTSFIVFDVLNLPKPKIRE